MIEGVHIFVVFFGIMPKLKSGGKGNRKILLKIKASMFSRVDVVGGGGVIGIFTLNLVTLDEIQATANLNIPSLSSATRMS